MVAPFTQNHMIKVSNPVAGMVREKMEKYKNFIRTFFYFFNIQNDDTYGKI